MGATISWQHISSGFTLLTLLPIAHLTFSTEK